MLLLIYFYLFIVIVILLIVLAVVVAVKGYISRGGDFKLWGKRVLAVRAKSKAHGVILGRTSRHSVCYLPEGAEGHVVVFGPTGKGKTSALLIPTLRSWQGTALVIDISGDISSNVENDNKIVFDPQKLDTAVYNVFAAIDAAETEDEKNERLEQLAFLLMPDKPNDSEAGAFFTREGRKILTAALTCYYYEGWGFIEICEFILSNDWRSLMNDIAKHDNKIANMNLSGFLGSNDQNNAGCKQSCDSVIKLFGTNSNIKRALRKTKSYEKTISPASLETNSIYICVDEPKLELYAPMVRIITAQSMEYFFQRPKKNKQAILFCLDEFASLGKMDILAGLRRLRKRRVFLMVLTQELADIDLVYGKDERKAMMGNFAVTVLLGCKNPETQEYFQKLIGNKKSLFAIETDDQKKVPIVEAADLAKLDDDLIVISDDGYRRLRKNYYFKK